MGSSMKEWSIFIYLNGNNELEPEMWNTKIDIEKVSSNEKINIVVQLAREERKVAQLMRPQENILEDVETWTGVRRLYIEDNTSKVLEDLGKVNMADYNTLNQFILWGIQNYPAKKNMVIISGHGFMVASLSDLSGKKPNTMGLYEMCTAINSINGKINTNIDILVLDICYMNNIELIYEFGKEKENVVKNILTFMESGPIGGLQYSKLISSILYSKDFCNVREILKRIIYDINENLISIEVNNYALNELRNIYNEYGLTLLTEFKNQSINDTELINNNKIRKFEEQISKLVEVLVICYNKKTKGQRKLINIFSNDMYNIENRDGFLTHYNKLEFSKNNYWGNYVAGKEYNEPLNMKESFLSSYDLTKDNIYAFIKVFNFNLPQDKIEVIMDELYRYKKWENS